MLRYDWRILFHAGHSREYGVKADAPVSFTGIRRRGGTAVAATTTTAITTATAQ